MKTLLFYLGMIISAPFYLIYRFIVFLDGVPILSTLMYMLSLITIIWAVFDSRDNLMLAIGGGLIEFVLISTLYTIISSIEKVIIGGLFFITSPFMRLYFFCKGHLRKEKINQAYKNNAQQKQWTQDNWHQSNNTQENRKQQAGYNQQYNQQQQTGYRQQYHQQQQTGYRQQYHQQQQTGYRQQYNWQQQTGYNQQYNQQQKNGQQWQQNNQSNNQQNKERKQFRKNNYEEQLAWAKKIYNFSEQDTTATLKRKMRILTKKYHPDQRNGDEEAMKNINVAYEILRKYVS